MLQYGRWDWSLSAAVKMSSAIILATEAWIAVIDASWYVVREFS